ncbi:MAG: oligosaccharide flippase family protein [Candidatus Limnocylindria bacterium]
MSTTVTPFARRVAGVFATRVARLVIGFATSFLLAGMLLPEGRGQYALLVLVPGMLNALGQLGLPSAMSFFAGRGMRLDQLQRLGWGLTVLLSALLIGGTVALLPILSDTALRAVPGDLILVALASVPFQFATAFAGSTLIGRQRLRNYNLIVVGQSALMLAGVVVLVGVLGLGVAGALISYVTVAIFAAVLTALELHRVVRTEPATGSSISVASFMSYGIRIYPASVTGYFSYRADVLILGAMLGDAVAIGLYTFAVSLAELAFMVPDSVSTVLFPRIAGMGRREADALAPQVSRFTLLVTGIAVLGLIPAAYLATNIVLPAYAESMTAFAILLPGIMALAVSKVLAGYIGGLGLPLMVARASVTNLVVNIIGNLALIPTLGIAGAALASMISYVVHASMLAVIAARIAHRRPLEYVVPTGAEVHRLGDAIRSVVARIRRGWGS